MRQLSTATIIWILVVATAETAGARQAVAAEPEPEPPVTPFIDSGNDLPDLAARERWPSPPPREPTPRGKWYGWQMLVGDLAAFGCLAASEHPICLIPLPFSGPAVHLAHGRPGRAGASIGMRLGGAALGFSVGRALANCKDSRSSSGAQSLGDGVTLYTNWDGLDNLCGLDYAAVGGLIGLAAAAVIDAAVSFDSTAPGTGPEGRARPVRTIEPALSIGQDRVSLGLGGAF